MAFLIKLTSLFLVTALASAQQYENYPLPQQQYNPALLNPLRLQPQRTYGKPRTYTVSPNENPPISAYLPLIQKYVPGAKLTLDPNDNPATSYLPLNQQKQQLPKVNTAPVQFYKQELPKVEAAPVPFYSEEPSTELRPPQGFPAPQVNFFDVPVPSQELQVPSQTPWNPENDPRFFFDNPSPNDDEVPTRLHPKKYNKEVHATAKPYAKVKEDLDVYAGVSAKNKNAEKARNNLAKLENQKKIQAEKKPKKPKRPPPPPTTSSPAKSELQAAESGYDSGFDGDGVEHIGHSGGFSGGMGAELKAALGSGHHHPKERVEFQMHGHDGPDSYKWGFDHGEG